MAVRPGWYFDDLETMTAADREKYRTVNLRRTVDQAFRNSVWARRLLERAGLRPESIRTAQDLELLPITRKNDLIEAQKTDPPFGGLLAVPLEDVERVFISPGPLYEFQPSGIQWFARSFHAAGFGRGDIVVNTFTYHMSPAGVLFHEGLRQVGAAVVVMGTGNTDALIKAIVDLKITGFLGTPSFLMSVIRRAEDLKIDFRQLSVKKAWFTGEMLPPSLRRVFEQDYHLSTSQAYAVTEPGGAIAYECPEKSGLHLMDEYIVEIVDPQTEKPLPPGEIGEIVVTPLHNNTWGLLRFGTGDLSCLVTEPCLCGRTSARLPGLMGRAGDAVKVRGMFIVAKQAEQVIAGFSAVSRFRIVVDRKSNRDEMALTLELKEGTEVSDRLRDEINQKFQDACRVKLDKIEIAAAGTIPEPHKTLEDIRRWD